MRRDLQVIYIVGCGRSGSTILDTVVGNHGMVESVGELINAPRAWTSEGEFCACGERVNDCGFWTAVQEIWRASLPSDIQALNWIQLQSDFERYRNVNRILWRRKKYDSAFQSYSIGIAALYRAIQQVSGKPVILDSSKNPLRALALTCVPDIQVKLIHLVRDGRGVSWSLKKSYKKDPKKGIQKELKGRSVVRTSLFWWLTNRLSELAYKRVPVASSIQVRYEDFIASPSRVLENIAVLTELDFDAIKVMLSSGDNFNVGHTVAGNRLRMTKRVKLRSDMEWKDHLSPFDQSLFWFIAGRMAARYGYHRSE